MRAILPRHAPRGQGGAAQSGCFLKAMGLRWRRECTRIRTVADCSKRLAFVSCYNAEWPLEKNVYVGPLDDRAQWFDTNLRCAA
jgi:hypothetical protein